MGDKPSPSLRRAGRVTAMQLTEPAMSLRSIKHAITVRYSDTKRPKPSQRSAATFLGRPCVPRFLSKPIEQGRRKVDTI